MLKVIIESLHDAIVRHINHSLVRMDWKSATHL
jgi:hypothetical protein